MPSNYETILREVNHAFGNQFQQAGFGTGEIRFGSQLTTILRFRKDDLGFIAVVSYDGITAFDAKWLLIDSKTLTDDHSMWAIAPAAVDAGNAARRLSWWESDPHRFALTSDADELRFVQAVMSFMTEAVIPVLHRTEDVRALLALEKNRRQNQILPHPSDWGYPEITWESVRRCLRRG